MLTSRHPHGLQHRVDHDVRRHPGAGRLETEDQAVPQHAVCEPRDVVGNDVGAPRRKAMALAVRQNAMVARGLAPYSMSRAVFAGRCCSGSRVTPTRRLAYWIGRSMCTERPDPVRA